MSANLDRIDLNSDVVSVEPENDVRGVSILEPIVKVGLSDANTLTDRQGESHQPVVDQVRDFEEANGLKEEIVDGLSNGGLEREAESVEKEMGSVGRESNAVFDVSSGEAVQVTETRPGEIEGNRLVQVEKEEEEGIPTSSACEDSVQVKNAGNSVPLARVVDVEVKEASTNCLLPHKDVIQGPKGITSECTGYEAVELDDQANTSEGISEENDENSKSGALNLVVDLNPYVSMHGNDSGNVNVKTSASKLEFSVSDLVWGKVRSHPWWPGQIFDPSDASEKAKKYFKRNSYLIAYFGDQTFAWNEASTIKPFRSHFSQMEKQNNSEEFHYAIDCALDEISRRIEFGLACPCISEFGKNNTQLIVNAGIREDSSRRVGGDSFTSADAFEPTKLVDYVKTLGQLPFGEVDRLEIVTAKAQLLAFSRWKGYSQLPEFQILGTLLLCDTEVAQLVSIDGKCGNQLNENSGAEIRDDEHLSPVKVLSKGRDHSTPKRKYISGDSVYPRKKEKSLADLMAERRISVRNGKRGLGIKATGKLISPSSGEKRKAVDSMFHDHDSVQKHSKILSSSEGGINSSSQPKRTFRVGDSILRAASQLNEPIPMLKSINGAFLESAMKDMSNEKSPAKSQGKELFKIEDSSSDEMVYKLCLVARDPMNECSFLKSVVSFFVGFRNSVCLEHLNPLLHKPSFLEFVLSDNIVEESSKSETETCESEYAKDSCSKDEIIRSVPQELASLEIQNGAVDIPPETTTKNDNPPIELRPAAQSSPNLDFAPAYEILNMESMKPVDHLEENCNDDHTPTALILKFSHLDSIPSESDLNKIFSRFGRVKESETEVLKKSNSAKVVFCRRDDAEAAFSSAGKYRIFGPSLVSYRLKYMPSLRSKSTPNKTKSGKKKANSVEGNAT